MPTVSSVLPSPEKGIRFLWRSGLDVDSTPSLTWIPKQDCTLRERTKKDDSDKDTAGRGEQNDDDNDMDSLFGDPAPLADPASTSADDSPEVAANPNKRPADGEAGDGPDAAKKARIEDAA